MLCNLCIVDKHLLYAICIKFKITTRVIYTGVVTRLTRRVIAYHSGAPESTPSFQQSSCYSIFSFMCMFCRSLFVLFGHCVVCPSSIYNAGYLVLWQDQHCTHMWKALASCIGCTKKGGLAHKTNLTYHFVFIEVPPVLSQTSQW